MLRTKKLLQLIFSSDLVSVDFAVVVVAAAAFAAVSHADAVAILFYLFIFWSLHTGFQIPLINRRVYVCVCIEEPRQSKLT